MDTQNIHVLIEKAIKQFEVDYENFLSTRIVSENTIQAYLFNYLNQYIDNKKYILLTEFYVSKFVRHDIVILETETYYKYYNGSLSNFKALMECDKVAIIEIKHTALFSKKEGFEKDLNNLSNSNSKYKYFISIQCQKEYELYYTDKFKLNNINAYFIYDNFWK